MTKTDEMLCALLDACGAIKRPLCVSQAEGNPNMIYSVPRYKVQLVRDGVQTVDEKLINGPEVAVALARSYIPDDGNEHAVVIGLDTQNKMIGMLPLSSGSIDRTIVDPGDVFSLVFAMRAAAFVLIHNHPSGEPTPSAEDRKVCRTISEIGTKLKRPMLDFLIIGSGTNRYYSAKKEGSYDLK